MACVKLRPIRMSDAETCFRWVSDPDVRRLLGLIRPARSVEQERAWIAGVLADKEQQRVFVIADEHGQAIGTCGLRGIDRREGTGFLGIMIGEKTLWNQGYGTYATKALLEYAFGELGLREVQLSCHPDNRGALRCYEKAGFRPRGPSAGERPFRRAEVRMAITRERWESLPGLESESTGDY
ncbi:MAG: GNAT family N-acetyltransferase [Armatimonadota bacterium]|nr:MAG: GNAT family N-acetyltransferase [Armatimonadota bacterium]